VSLFASLGFGLYSLCSLHLQECFASPGCQPSSFPVREEAARRTLALPIYPEVIHDEQEYVVDYIREFFG